MTYRQILSRFQSWVADPLLSSIIICILKRNDSNTNQKNQEHMSMESNIRPFGSKIMNLEMIHMAKQTLEALFTLPRPSTDLYNP